MEPWQTKIKIYISGGDMGNFFYGTFWVAEIVGIHPDADLEFKRKFLNFEKEDVIIEKDGIYEIFRQWFGQREDYFILVECGYYSLIDKDTVYKLLKKYYK